MRFLFLNQFYPPDPAPTGRYLHAVARVRVEGLLKFQSSPAPEDGRYDFAARLVAGYRMFQSSPAPEDGRYRVTWPRKPGQRSFNPRPPQRTGATRMERPRRYWIGVSI